MFFPETGVSKGHGFSRRKAPQLTVSLAFTHACAVQQFLQTWYSAASLIELPPSLKNIYREIENECGTRMPESGNLDRWAKQGVFLLNVVLTVRAHEANSHRMHGWEKFTDKVIEEIEKQDRYIVYMLWGKPAQMKADMVKNPKHLVLQSSHPSPLSAYRSYDGFFGNGHFVKCNDFFIKHGEKPIEW